MKSFLSQLYPSSPQSSGKADFILHFRLSLRLRKVSLPRTRFLHLVYTEGFRDSPLVFFEKKRCGLFLEVS